MTDTIAAPPSPPGIEEFKTFIEELCDECGVEHDVGEFDVDNVYDLWELDWSESSESGEEGDEDDIYKNWLYRAPVKLRKGGEFEAKGTLSYMNLPVLTLWTLDHAPMGLPHILSRKEFSDWLRVRVSSSGLT